MFHRILPIIAASVALLLGHMPALSAEEGTSSGVPAVAPGNSPLDDSVRERVAELMREAIANERCPGAVIILGSKGRVVFRQAFGDRQWKPERVAMTVATVFDLASLTKPVATACSVMLLVERGQIDLDAPAAKYIPSFGTRGKEAITVRQLLTHVSGLTPDNALSDYAGTVSESYAKIDALPLLSEPGDRFRYSDVGFIMLGRIVEQVSGRSLDQFAKKELFDPLGMTETGFNPPEKLHPRTATTQQRNGKWLRGEVHDPRAFRLGGVAGHAGLFSTVDDLAVFSQMLLNGGQFGETRVLKPQTIASMTTSQTVPYRSGGTGLRTLGWDRRTGYSTNRGSKLGSNAFGHGGFTGTVLWIDPDRDLFFLFLSSRVHPNGTGSVNRLAGRILDELVTGLDDSMPH